MKRVLAVFKFEPTKARLCLIGIVGANSFAQNITLSLKICKSRIREN